MFDLDDVHQLFRLSHIIVGFAGLGLFWIPVLAVKGSRLHILSGRAFVGCTYYVGATGLVGSIWGIVHPESFFADGAFQSLDAEQARRVAEDLRFILSITGFLALAIMAGVTLGVRAMRRGDASGQVRTPALLVLLVATGLWSAGLAVYGGASLIAGYADWHFISSGTANRYWLNMALGVFGVFGTIGDLKFLYEPEPTRAARRAVHIQCMLGSGAGFYAAFFLFGASRVFGLTGIWQIIAPLTPLVLASIAAKWVVGREQHRIAQASPP